MLVFLLLIYLTGQSQQTINVDDPNNNNIVNLNSVNGEPVTLAKYNRVVEGSIFVPENFTPCMILLKNNKRATAVRARINIIEQTLHYLDKDGREFFTRVPVDEIHFTDSLLHTTSIVFTQSPAFCNSKYNKWFEVLEKGKVSLYCEIQKTISENKPYGSATTEQKVNTFYKYWMQSNNECKQVQKISDFIAELKKLNPAIEEKLAGMKFSDKKKADWVNIAEKFNSLNEWN